MSTHTTHFCDHCNADHDITHGDDDGHAITYSEYPPGDGWAEFRAGRPKSIHADEIHICAHCLADPDFEPDEGWWIAEWDGESKDNLARGRAHAERFRWAQEHLGTKDRWGFRGVRQVFVRVAYRVGPKLEDGRFSPSDRTCTVA